ncbi:hypothetical protein ACPA9J_16940 [Pseudomonas aeruginosa]
MFLRDGALVAARTAVAPHALRPLVADPGGDLLRPGIQRSTCTAASDQNVQPRRCSATSWRWSRSTWK